MAGAFQPWPSHDEIIIQISARYTGFTPSNPKITQSNSDLQLFIGKYVFQRKKLIFGGIKQSTRVLVQIQKNLFFAKICCKFLAFLCFLQQQR